jgi:aspartate-semialdehyde dehydrogenase
MMGYSRVAVVGATGLVGLELLSILEKRPGEINRLKLYASDRSVGRTLWFRGRPVPVEPVEKIDCRGLDVAFFMAGAEVSLAYVPKVREAGALVIDNSSAYRRDPAVPLVVPECNPRAISGHGGLIANPNCTVVQIVVGIKPIYEISPIRRLVVSTYQSISGAGREELERLVRDTRGYMERGGGSRPASPPERSLDRAAGEDFGMAFDLRPGIDRLLEDGMYFEEEKILVETRKIFGDDEIRITATSVRVPVLRGHSISACMETEGQVDLSEAEGALRRAPGVKFMGWGEDLSSLSPAAVAGKDYVVVGRLRRDRHSDNGLLMWIVADNLRKGAALNAVQIADMAFDVKSA